MADSTMKINVNPCDFPALKKWFYSKKSHQKARWIKKWNRVIKRAFDEFSAN